MTGIHRSLGAKSKSPTILWFLQRHGFSSAEIGMRSLAQRLIKLYGDQTPPFDPTVIARELKANQISFGSIGKDALLIPTDNGFRIKISSELPKSRQRFALAHELGHTLFFNTDSQRPFRPYAKAETDSFEERLCDIFAGEVLIPEHSLRPHLRNAGEPKLETLLDIARTFDVSVWCLSIRIAGLKLWDAAIVNWAPDNAETVSIPAIGLAPKLRVSWEATPRGYFIPRSDSAKSSSAVYLCYLNGDQIDTDEVMSLGSVRGTHHLSCMRIPDAYNEGNYSVLSLIKLSPSSHENKM
jgi:hypothetical protein